MKISHNKYKTFRFSALFAGVITLVLAGVFILATQTFAYYAGNAGGGNIGGSAGCYWDDGSIKNPNTCTGGVWMSYKITDADRQAGKITFTGFSSGGASGELPLDNCGDADVYYRLALIDVYQSSQSSDGKVHAVQFNNTVWPLKDFALSGGGGAFYVNADNDNAVSWNEAYKKFNTAKKRGAEMNGYDWNSSSNLALFCYNEAWEDRGGYIESTSTVNIPAQVSVLSPISKTSGRDDMSSANVSHTTAQEEITVEFWHDLYFTPNEALASVYRSYGNDETGRIKDQIRDIASRTRDYWNSRANYARDESEYERYRSAAEEDYNRIMEIANSIPYNTTNVFGPVTGKYSISETDSKNREFTVNPGAGSNWGWDWHGQVEKETVVVKLPNMGDTKTVCRTIRYNPKNIFYRGDPTAERETVVVPAVYQSQSVRFEYTKSVTYAATETNGGGGSKACATITRSPITNSNGSFYSNSTVEVAAQNDVPSISATSGYSNTSNSKAIVKISTDTDSVDVTFKHRIFYTDEMWNATGGTACPYGWESHTTRYLGDDRCADYDVDWGGDYSGRVASGSNCTNNSSSNSGRVVSETPTSVPIGPGETVTVCQKISHNATSVEIQKTQKTGSHRCWDGFSRCYRNTYYEWRMKDRDVIKSASSEACITITRPENPVDYDPGDPGNPPSTDGYPVVTGTTGTDIVYAGEETRSTWKTKAEAVDTRRLSAYQAINFFIPPSITYKEDKSRTTGTTNLSYPNRNNQDPCSWYRGAASWSWCGVVNGREHQYDASKDAESVKSTEYGKEGQDEDKGSTEQVTVPDVVGGKYCTSFGYKWEYWYYIDDATHSQVWTHETNKDYWTNYNASCRTVAKKPSVAYWNAGVLTNSGVTTITSSRSHNVPTTGPIVWSKSDATYGSWTEYLASVNNGNINGFSSAAGFSRGGSLSTNLSITANGYSGISPSEALRTRLEGYLKSLASAPVNVNSLRNVDKTTIASFNNSITISENITLKDDNYYNSIYELPQVVLFVDGGVNIAGNVNRIDAWIITSKSGSLKTCNVFAAGGSETYANGWAGNRNCDNQLAINGPVLVDGNVSLKRTYGSNPDNINGTQTERYTPAEIFNLSAENYLWAYAQASRYASSYTEGYSRELPPRY